MLCTALVLIFLLLTPLRLNSCSSDSKTNLPKYTTLHLTHPTLLETSASSLIDILLSLTNLQLSLKPVTITFVNFAVSGLALLRQLPVPLLHLSFTPNLITVILSTINSLSLNYPISSRSRTVLPVLSWKLPCPVISLPSYALFTGSGWLNASNTSSSHLPTKFSLLPNLRAFITSSPLDVLKYSLFIRRYCCLASFIIISKNDWSLVPLRFTLSLESAPFVSSSTLFWYQFFNFLLPYSFTHHFFLFWFTTLYIPLSFTPGLKPISFTNRTPHSFTSSFRTASTDFRLDRFF